jgi:hypothetical protein
VVTVISLVTAPSSRVKVRSLFSATMRVTFSRRSFLKPAAATSIS